MAGLVSRGSAGIDDMGASSRAKEDGREAAGLQEGKDCHRGGQKHLAPLRAWLMLWDHTDHHGTGPRPQPRSTNSLAQPTAPCSSQLLVPSSHRGFYTPGFHPEPSDNGSKAPGESHSSCLDINAAAS